MTTLNDKLYAKLIKKGKQQKLKGKHPFDFLKFTIIAVLIIIVVLFGEYTDYQDYQKYFQNFSRIDSDYQYFDEKELHIYPKNDNYASTRRYYPNYGLSENNMHIKFSGLSGWAKGNIDIPADKILGCSTTQYNENSSKTFLILKQEELGLRIRNFPEIKDWCFANKIPLFTSQEINDWQYNKNLCQHPKAFKVV